jgi:hypothetical protein
VPPQVVAQEFKIKMENRQYSKGHKCKIRVSRRLSAFDQKVQTIIQASMKRDRLCVVDAKNFGMNLGMVFHEVKTFILALHTLKIARMISYFGQIYSQFYTLNEVIENIQQLET